MTIDNAHKFDTHMHGMCEKANQNIPEFGQGMISKILTEGALGAILQMGVAYLQPPAYFYRRRHDNLV